ncbi:MAG: hypothetical protein SFU85_00290 [Candidatus Methylacidiphilales bacterium]|nr:hypothetical protein [Candidatus Methylacidiphilales bacterium]
MRSLPTLSAWWLLTVLTGWSLYAEPAPLHLPGELSADQILNGEYPFPASPAVEVQQREDGLARDRLSPVPEPGVHPRLLISPEDLPGLRRRLKETSVGKALYSTLQQRLDSSIRDPKNWGSEFYQKLAKGDADAVNALVREKKGMPPGVGHYQPFLYAIVLEAFDALITEDLNRGKKAATAIATYAEMIRPGIEKASTLPMGDDSWRAKTSGPKTGTELSDQGLRDGVGGHLLGYAYDFSHPFMTEAQRASVRKTIAAATYGKLWMGARLPHHFRNWNWCAVGLQQPLLALSIEGEEGYDPRVYKMGVDIARDYLTYGISPAGMSTEAVGYTQFGLVWANPFIVAAQRRGAPLLTHGHFRSMVDWYLHTTVPSRDQWLSYGDGGDAGPSIGTLSLWRYFFPTDPKIQAVWRSFRQANGEKSFQGGFHIIEPILWVDEEPVVKSNSDGPARDLVVLDAPRTLFDSVRSSLSTRSSWEADAAHLQFECRTDSVGASHEHSDRGHFTFAALGRVWAKDNFRSVEARHHNGILIDGKGQGYWPGPGVWLGLEEKGDNLIASCDAKPAYDWFWPKQILTENPETFVRFQFPRWESYRAEAADFQKKMAGIRGEKDNRPSVVQFWKGFEKGDVRLWDEDAWPIRYPFNPVQRAFRTVAFHRGKFPYLIVTDDIQKDQQERLYEWLMQTGPNTEVVSYKDNDLVLGDATLKRDENGQPKPVRGDRLLLVRILNMNEPQLARDYQTRPSVRLETFERRDTLTPTVVQGSLSGGRSFGLDKRLVIASRSVSPNFRILLFPYRHGEENPLTVWNEDRTQLEFTLRGRTQKWNFKTDPHGRTLVSADK